MKILPSCENQKPAWWNSFAHLPWQDRSLTWNEIKVSRDRMLGIEIPAGHQSNLRIDSKNPDQRVVGWARGVVEIALKITACFQLLRQQAVIDELVERCVEARFSSHAHHRTVLGFQLGWLTAQDVAHH